VARGFLSGVILGTVVAGAGAGALSLATDIPRARAPQTGVSAPEVTAPDMQTAALPDVKDEAEQPAVKPAAPQGQAPDTDRTAETDTATAAKPDATSETAALSQPETGSAPEVFSETDTPPGNQTPGVAPEMPLSESTPELTDEATPEPEAEAAQPVPLPDEEREEITLTVPNVPEAEPSAPVPAAQGEQTARVSIGTPARTLGSGSSSRLPSLGAESTENSGDTPQDASAPAGSVDIADLPPVERFASPFAGQADTPKMAIVLIDDGTSDIGVEALSTFPYPLSFAVDTSWSGAEDAMAKYRASGFEVLAMVNLPSGARATDVEVSMPVLLGKVPEAVGIMETPDAGLQTSREVIEQVTEYANDSGHGLLLFPKGLNTAQKLAAKEGVPSATVFRDFDSKGQNASTIKRFLNHAGMKAGAEGGVVMLGRLRADTISALLLWGLQERGDRLELAPVSQLLKVQ
jgi:uncharacterized protein